MQKVDTLLQGDLCGRSYY